MYNIDEIRNTILCGHVLKVLKEVPDESVDMVVTSPPYWALRNYKTDGQIWDEDENCSHEWGEVMPDHHPGQVEQTKWKSADAAGSGQTSGSGQFCQKCGAWKGELGLEPSYDLFVKHLCDIFDEIKRILKPYGTCWVNLGDTYNSHLAKSKNVGGFEGRQMKKNQDYSDSKIIGKGNIGLPDKCLVQIPARFAIEMTNRGWVLRNELIWEKVNCMPSSAADRFTVEFEKIFFFSKNPHYYFEQQLEKGKDIESRNALAAKEIVNPTKYTDEDKYGGGGTSFKGHSGFFRADGTVIGTPGYRNKRCVWRIKTKPFSEAHFAVFPPELVETPIKAGCPEFVCEYCGEPQRVVVDKKSVATRPNKSTKDEDGQFATDRRRFVAMYGNRRLEGCECGKDFRSGIVLDPFMGSGTTGMVAKRLNRDYLGVDLNSKYIKIAEKRIKEDLYQAKVKSYEVDGKKFEQSLIPLD